MAYRLKEIRYQSQKCHILLQNENGPCPLLAAANCLLLKGSISLPSNCIGAGVVTIDQLVNVLAEKILLSNQTEGSDHHIQEVMNIFPTLQFGMDVNPKFTAGPSGVEYTMQLNAFDLLHIELVHGWLIEPDAQEYELIGNQTYNQLINAVIEGNEASSALQQDPNVPNHDELSTKATKGSIIHHFLEHSGHQLTQHGLHVLHEHLKDGQMVVFFRNNHFNTLTKHDGLLYLLVTDLGYANVQSVVWEKLDVIDGDTEYVKSDFTRPPPVEGAQAAVNGAVTGEQLLANNMQSQADYQLALQLSRETSGNEQSSSQQLPPQKDPDMEAARQASLLHQQGTVAVIPPPTTPTPTPATNTSAPTLAAEKDYVAVAIPTAPPSQEDQDMMFALQLQRQEEREREQRAQQARQAREAAQTPPRARNSPAPPPTRLPMAPGNKGKDSNCVIS